MKKAKYSRTLIMIISFLIYVFINLFVFYQQKQTTYDIVSNLLYYENALIIQQPSKPFDWSQIQFNDKNYGVYIEINKFTRIEVIDSSERTPPMIWGQYPKNTKDKQKAVVGKPVYDNITTINDGKKLLKFLGQEFEIVGVIGTNYVSPSDNLVILFNPEVNEYIKNKPIVVDSKNKTDLSVIEDLIISKNPDIKIMKRDITGTARLTKSSFYFNLLYIEAIAIIAVTIILVSKLQWGKYKNIRKVYFILGIPKSKVVLYQILEMITINGCSFVMSAILGKQFNIVNITTIKPISQIASIIVFFYIFLIIVSSFMENLNFAKFKTLLHKYRNEKGTRKCT